MKRVVPALLVVFLFVVAAPVQAKMLKQFGTDVIKPRASVLKTIALDDGQEIKLRIYAAEPKSRKNVVKVKAKIKIPDYNQWINLGTLSYPFTIDDRWVEYKWDAKKLSFSFKDNAKGKDVNYQGKQGVEWVKVGWKLKYGANRRVSGGTQ
jgi:hypothetical protein